MARGPFGAIIYGSTPNKPLRDAVVTSFDDLATAAVGLTRRVTATASGDGSFALNRVQSVAAVTAGGAGGVNITTSNASTSLPVSTEDAPFLTPRGKSKPRSGVIGGAWAFVAPVFEVFGLNNREVELSGQTVVSPRVQPRH